MASLDGYIRDDKLFDFQGKPKGNWEVYSSDVERYRTPEGDGTRAVILTKRWDTGSDLGERLMIAAGYWLGPDAGDLFRGEIMPGQFRPDTTHGRKQIHEALKEAEQLAKAESEHWIRLDQEAQEQADAEIQAVGEYPEHFSERESGWGPLLSGSFGTTARDVLERTVYYATSKERRGRVDGHRAVAPPGAPDKELVSLASFSDDDLRSMLPLRLQSSFSERMAADSSAAEIAERLSTIRVLWRAPDTLALWGIPYEMRPGQSPKDIWRAHHEYSSPRPGHYGSRQVDISDWIWLGQPGWWGDMPKPEQAAVAEFIAAAGDAVPESPGEWSELG